MSRASLVESWREGEVARIVLDRPDQRNAASVAMLGQLGSVLDDLAVDPDVRVVVLAGSGSDFCAGADFADLTSDRSGVAAYGAAFEKVLRSIESHPRPVLARIQGSALGAGCQLAVACDLAVAAEDARMGIPSVRLGLLINYENIERLALALGPKRAGEILFTGRTLSGTEAADWGLVNRAVPVDTLDAAVEDLAGQVAAAAPLSVSGSKRGLRVAEDNMRIDRSLHGDRLADFDMMAAEVFSSEDLQEGIQAFRERRKPRFHGR